MSHSFWKVAATPWTCIAILVVGSTQMLPVDAGVQGQTEIKGSPRAHLTVQSQAAAGRLTIDAVASFDVNSMHSGVFGDSEVAPSLERKKNR